MTKENHASLGLTSDDGHMHLPRRGAVWRAAKIVALIFAALLAAGALRVILARGAAKAALKEQAEQGQKIFVATVNPTPTKSAGALTLPATLRGDNETQIYARVSGYVRSFLVDIGAKVRKGQVLAELDTPELDQQVAQAAAQLENAKANTVLADAALKRWKLLFAQNSVARQDLDTKQNAYDTAVALQNSAGAYLKQLQETSAFKHVMAPFDGVITARNVDVGNLITAGGAGSALFGMARPDPLRVAIDVPQAYSLGVKVGDEVVVTQAELPGQTFLGQISRIAGAIDTATRAQRVELALPNPDGRLTPGAYVQVTLPLTPKGPLSIPANTLLFRAEGPSVAVVDAEGIARLRPVAVVNDLGATLEISQGVALADRIVVNPPDSLVDGAKVTPRAEPARP
ncbi:efflux RND transporter periplasmic adaptor subunit [uncultured Rhodoblastus sp.]|uniref:efflux RND transporter periplasmic adaptor subunit n=1 Tax=uncultured Rhodoblastus sp. TaxID=543037 RepID=UPI0025FC16B9|nr:efflux RND transporter periplasmic adaptor subunit [uncultured Rhodoblastus sp.]